MWQQLFFVPIILLISNSAYINSKPVMFFSIISYLIDNLSTIIGIQPNILIVIVVKMFLKFITKIFPLSIVFI